MNTVTSVGLENSLLYLIASQAAIELDCARLGKHDPDPFRACREIGEALLSIAEENDLVAHTFIIEASVPSLSRLQTKESARIAEIGNLFLKKKLNAHFIELRDFCCALANRLVDHKQFKRYPRW